jgi:uncharacterized protein (DUF305 family)
MMETKQTKMALLAAGVGVLATVGMSAPGAVAAGDDGNGRSVQSRVIVPRGPGQPADVVSVRSARVLEVAGRSARSEQANDADRHFVSHMIPHHYQAILMSELAPQRSADRRLRALAERIRIEQGVEIDSLQGWQGREGLPVTDEVESYHHVLQDPEMLEHMGMANRRQMTRLEAADGRAFDRMYIKLMIPHHQGAIRMAEEVAGTGNDVFVRQLAIDLISSQSRQVYDMRQIRKSWTD